MWKVGGTPGWISWGRFLIKPAADYCRGPRVGPPGELFPQPHDPSGLETSINMESKLRAHPCSCPDWSGEGVFDISGPYSSSYSIWRGSSLTCVNSTISLSILMWRCWISPCQQNRWAAEGLWALSVIPQRALDKYLITKMDLWLLLPTPTCSQTHRWLSASFFSRWESS
jgi:hypothetical protein